MTAAAIIAVLIGIVVLAVLAYVLMGGRGTRPQEVGRDVVDRQNRPHAEKEQMDAPQEEFIQDDRPPSG